jgi:hypothetical protein
MQRHPTADFETSFSALTTSQMQQGDLLHLAGWAELERGHQK